MTPEQIREEQKQLAEAIQYMVLAFQQKTGTRVKSVEGSSEELFTDESGKVFYAPFRLSIDIAI